MQIWTGEIGEFMLKLNNIIIDSRLLGRSIKRIGNFTTCRGKLLFKCLICDYEFNSIVDNIVNKKKGCPKCQLRLPPNNQKIDYFLKNKSIYRIGDVFNSINLCEYGCNICNYKWKANANNIFNGTECLKCSGNLPVSLEERQRKLTDEKNITILYKNGGISNKWDFKCNICNNVWSAEGHSVVNGKNGCPGCKNKEEGKIATILDFYNVCYKRNKMFIIENKKMFVDFYIKEKNTIIERNGEQHYMPVRFGGMSYEKALIQFEKQKIRDLKLRKYCSDNKIKLIEIPYYFDKSTVIKSIEELHCV